MSSVEERKMMIAQAVDQKQKLGFVFDQIAKTQIRTTQKEYEEVILALVEEMRNSAHRWTHPTFDTYSLFSHVDILRKAILNIEEKQRAKDTPTLASELKRFASAYLKYGKRILIKSEDNRDFFERLSREEFSEGYFLGQLNTVGGVEWYFDKALNLAKEKFEEASIRDFDIRNSIRTAEAREYITSEVAKSLADRITWDSKGIHDQVVKALREDVSYFGREMPTQEELCGGSD